MPVFGNTGVGLVTGVFWVRKRWFVGIGLAVLVLVGAIVWASPSLQFKLVPAVGYIQSMIGLGEFRVPIVAQELEAINRPIPYSQRKIAAFGSKIIMIGQDEALGAAALLKDGFEERPSSLAEFEAVLSETTRRRVFTASWSTVVCTMFAKVYLDIGPLGKIEKISGTTRETGCL